MELPKIHIKGWLHNNKKFAHSFASIEQFHDWIDCSGEQTIKIYGIYELSDVIDFQRKGEVIR